MATKSLQYGELYIADEVIAMIAKIAVSEVEGVVSTVSSIREDVVRAVNNRNMPKGITVTTEEDGVMIDLKVAIYFGKNIRTVCSELQNNIKEQVEMMSGLVVKEINIMVEQVNVIENE
jgi:uncharacterized alkaline shock family protein YloU